MKAGEVWLARLRGQRYVQRVMIDELSDRCVRAIPIDPYNVIDDRFYEIGKDIEFVEKLDEPPPEIRKVL